MATYKGIGYDTTNGKTRTGTSSDDISFDAQITATDAISVTAGGITVSAGGIDVTGGTETDVLSVTGDASVAGDLTVTGDIVSRGAVNLVVNDNFIDLNFANSTTTAEAGGLTVQMNRNAAFTASTVTTFVAGSAGVSNPTFTVTDAGSSSLLAAGDVVVITGATQEGNNGLYVVQGVNQASFPQVVTIKGTGTAAVDPATPWAQNQFEAESGATGSAFKTDLFVQLVADGSSAFTDGAGATYAKGTFLTAYHSNAVETDFSNDGGYTTVESTLQSAYNGGNTLTTNAGSDVPVSITLSRDGSGFEVGGVGAGTGIVNFGGSGLNAIDSFEFSAAGGPSVIESTAQNLTVQTVTSGTLAVTSAATLDLNAVACTLDATGGFTAALSGAASSITSTSQDLTIATATSGELDLTSAGLMDVNAGANLDIDVTGTFDVLATSTFSIDGTGASNVTATSGNLTVSTATSGNLVLNSAGNIDADGAAITIDGTNGVTIGSEGAAAGFNSTGQNLTISTTTSGTLAVTSAATLDLDGVTVNVDASGALSLQGALSSDLTLAANNASAQTLTIAASNSNAGASANIDIDADGIVTIDAGTSIGIGTNADKPIDIDSTTFDLDASGDVTIDASGNNNFQLATGTASTATGVAAITSSFPMLIKLVKAGEALSVGDVVCFVNDGGTLEARKGDADVATGFTQFTGICVVAAALDADAGIAFVGNIDQVTSTTAFNATNHLGKTVYLSTDAGKIQPSAPTTAGQTVFKVGICTGGSGTTWEVLIQPEFIMEIG